MIFIHQVRCTIDGHHNSVCFVQGCEVDEEVVLYDMRDVQASTGEAVGANSLRWNKIGCLMDIVR